MSERPRGPDGGREQRTDPRITAEHRVRMTVALHGFDAGDEKYEAKGITVNLSHNGALVRVDRPVTPGSRCLLHLPKGEIKLGKSLIYGTVKRSQEIEDTYEVAIAFDTRLLSISLEDSLDGGPS